MLIKRVTSDEAINAAFDWLCKKRRNYHHNHDVWQLRRWWGEKKPQLMAQLRTGTYRLREQHRVFSQGEEKEIWTVRDALVLKDLTLVLQEVLQSHLSGRCYHLAGTGGPKAAVREAVRLRSPQVDAHLPNFSQTKFEKP